MTHIKFRTPHHANRLQFLPSVFGELFNNYSYGDYAAKDLSKTIPPVNIKENTEGYIIEMAAPGLSKESFKIEVENQTLTISSTVSENEPGDTSAYKRKEFSYSSFKRSFKLPENVNTESISALYENGVLKLQLPKKDEAKQKPSREINIS